jgi:branched-chain amino acid transport system substrate-binding protein
MLNLPRRIADHSMTLGLCAAALCAAACKKDAPPSGSTGGTAAPKGGAPAGSSAGASAPATGSSSGKLVIGVMSDMSGLYADLGGQGSVVAAQMAAEEVGNSVAGMQIEVISADHQNKADIGSNIAREWYDTKNVDVIVDVPTSSVALAVSPITQDKNKVFLVSGAAASDLTGEKCTPNTIHWTYDTWALANAAGREIVKNGGDTWFFMTVDYAFGAALERDTRAAIEASGGKVVGAVKHPLNTPDFSSFLLQAQNSKAKIVALANAGGDTINSIKQSSEFGLTSKGQQIAGLLVFIADINALGLPTAKGLILSESFYWDRDDNTRAWSKKYAAKFDGRMPTMIHAGVYTSLLHYFKAVNELKSAKDGKAVVAKMKATPTDDTLFGKGTIDPNGRKRHAMYLYQVKTPEESKAKWDYYKLIREIPADQAFRKPADSKCPLVN